MVARAARGLAKAAEAMAWGQVPQPEWAARAAMAVRCYARAGNPLALAIKCLRRYAEDHSIPVARHMNPCVSALDHRSVDATFYAEHRSAKRV